MCWSVVLTDRILPKAVMEIDISGQTKQRAFESQMHLRSYAMLANIRLTCYSQILEFRGLFLLFIQIQLLISKDSLF